MKRLDVADRVLVWALVATTALVLLAYCTSCQVHGTGVTAGAFGMQNDADSQRGGASFIDGEATGLFVAVHTKLGRDHAHEDARDHRSLLREQNMQLARMEQLQKKSVQLRKEQKDELGGFLESWGPSGVAGAALIAALMAFKKTKADHGSA